MFTEEEKKLLEEYVTSADEDVFAIKNLNGVVGAVYARYSRAKGGFRKTLLKEFVKEGVLDPKHADELIQRVLIAYGDDSVGELEGTHISFENVSMLAAKEIEDRRIGGSPIEQSTRYVFYDQKDEQGGWKYLRHESILNASYGKEYAATMDFLFETYASLVEPMKEYFTRLLPLESAEYDINGDGKKERWSELTEEKDQKAFRTTYTVDIRTKACDTLRCLLPIGTLTNVGVFGNGRFFQTLISHMLTSDLPELQTLAEKTSKAAQQVIPQYVRRAARSRYLAEVRTNMRALAIELFGETGETPASVPQVTLVENADHKTSILAAALYPYSVLSLETLQKRLTTLSDEQKEKILLTAIGDRGTRRDRPGRGFESGYPLTFDLVINWGVYKDLQRHRVNTQQRQIFSTRIGFDVPRALIDAGFEEKVRECVKRSSELFELMFKKNPEAAQYAVLHGHLIRWMIGMNAREAFHMLELRTTPQGHPQYRIVCQMMHKEITKRDPWLAATMNFVDHNNYDSARGDSEARQRVKERQLEEKLQ